MKGLIRRDPFMRTVSSILIPLFLWNQLAWAGDIPIPVSVEVASTDSGMAEDEFLDRLDLQQSVVDNKNIIEGFVAEIMRAALPEEAGDITIFTPEGHRVTLSDERVTDIETKDGDTISDIVMDENGGLAEATVHLKDGRILYIHEGDITSLVDISGNRYEYDGDGTLCYIEFSDGRGCSASKGDDGSLTLMDNEKISVYTPSGDLSRVEYYNGKDIYYENGKIARLTENDGTEYFYSTVIGPGVTYDTVRLERIEKDGNNYLIDDGHITEIELADGTVLRKILLDADGKIVNAEVTCTDGTSYEVSGGRIREFRDLSGATAVYTYVSENEVIVDITDGDAARALKYSKDASSGNIIISEDGRNYTYSSEWSLLSFSDGTGTFEYIYDGSGSVVNTIFRGVNGDVNEYNEENDIVRREEASGAVYVFYAEGDARGCVEKVIQEDNVVFFEYGSGPDGGMDVVSRELYDGYETYASYYSTDYVPRATSPEFKATFTVDDTKSYSNLYLGASYFSSGNMSISFSLNMYNGSTNVYYSAYNYKTHKSEYVNECLDVDIVKGVEYTAELVWMDEGVGVFVYQSGSGRPSDPIYTIANKEWDPRFYISGSNASIGLDPASPGEFTHSESISSDYLDPLSGISDQAIEFYFDGNYSNRSFCSSVSVEQEGAYKCASLDVYGGDACLYLYTYDHTTYAYDSQSVDLGVVLDSDVTYMLENVAEGNDIYIYLHEKNQPRGDAVYVLKDFDGKVHVSSSITGGRMSSEIKDNVTFYSYNSSGKLTKREILSDGSTLEYIYDNYGQIKEKVVTDASGVQKTYDNRGLLLREEKPCGEVTVYGYDPDGNLISIIPEYPDGTEFEYYTAGDYEGQVKTVVLPNGDEFWFEYDTSPAGRLVVKKRTAYDQFNKYESYYGTAYISRSTDPVFKSDFTLAPDKIYSELFLGVSYYKYDEKSINVSLTVYGNKARIYYSKYNYVTGQNEYDSRELDIDVLKDTEYTLEYEWRSDGVYIFIYEASAGKPEKALYKINDADWDPKFHIRGTNADIELDTGSSGEYDVSSSYDSDYSYQISGSPVLMTEFTLDPAASTNSVSWGLSGQTSDMYGSIHLSYYNGTPLFNTYHYVCSTGKYENEKMEVPVTFIPGSTYVVEAVVDEDNRLEVFIYEKGGSKGEAVYFEDDCGWIQSAYSNVSGGECKVEAYDRLENIEYNTRNGLMIKDDVPSGMADMFLYLEPEVRKVEEYYLDSLVPRIFPNGDIDILTGFCPDAGRIVPLPGDMFDPSGELYTDYAFRNQYFDILMYDNKTGLLTASISPDGTRTDWQEGFNEDPFSKCSIRLMAPDMDPMALLDPIHAVLSEAVEYCGARTFYESGRVHVERLDDGITLEYSDEDWNGRHIGRLVKKTMPDGSYLVYEDHYAGTDQAKFVYEYDATGGLLNTYEYDVYGNIVSDFDIETDNFAMKTHVDDSITTYEKYAGSFRKNTFFDASAGTLEEYIYDGDTLSFIRTTYADGVSEAYEVIGGDEADRRLAEKNAPGQLFIKGVNLPWLRYGYDIGGYTQGGEPLGFSSDLGVLYEELNKYRNCTVRVFMFTDLRSGVDFDASGKPVSFTDKVYDDTRALFQAAKAFNIELIPVLFDYSIADGVTQEGVYDVGEHPDVIGEGATRQALFDLFDGFFEEFAGDPSVYAWDIINEPEYCTSAGMDEIKAFVNDMAALIHAKDVDAQVTVGAKNRGSLVDLWLDADLDVLQYHYYDDFPAELSLDHDARLISQGKPILAGELGPGSITHKYDVLYENNYVGGLIWQDGAGFVMSGEDRDALASWSHGATTDYSYYGSGRKQFEQYSNGLVREFEDVAMLPDGNGRLVSETYSTGAYKEYSYYEGTCDIKSIAYYLADGSIMMLETYDPQGEFLQRNLYYPDGSLKETRRADLTWESYDADGALLQRGCTINDTEVVYGPSGRMISLKKGSYIETRGYVVANGVVEYTTAINGGMVKATRDGYYDGTDLISRTDNTSGEDMVNVEYDGGISVGYADGSIAALSVDGGYMNFYCGNDVLSQNGSDGSLFEFESNYLKKVTTLNGNVYNFVVTADDDGVVVSLQSAIVNGIKLEFDDSVLSGLYIGSDHVDVVDITMLNGLTIGELKIDTGPGVETVTSGNAVFDLIAQVVEVMGADTPNIKFDYSADNTIKEILTSEFSRMRFADGLIEKTVSAEGVEVDYDYQRDDERNITGLKMTEPGAVRWFDANGILLKIEFDDGSVVNFDGGDVQSLEREGAILQDMTFNTDGDLEGARLFSADGSEYFFAGGSLADFIDSQNVSYELDDTGKIARLTKNDTGETFDVFYATDPSDGKTTITFRSQASGTEYIYKEDLLAGIVTDAGMEVRYEYYADDRTKKIEILYGGRAGSVYSYQYTGGNTVITDEVGNKRYYNGDHRTEKIETPYGETYMYAYDVDEDGGAVTTINYTYKKLDDGTQIEYFKGSIVKI
ncbi:MAG: hypothetical protein PHQ61_08095, partial [Candidatus Omnitrophica bacterium]|nr:hypothetical protein [Candidatus Omnitrophota bacterium]